MTTVATRARPAAEAHEALGAFGRAAIMALALAGLSAPALASQPEAVRLVRHADLDLESQRDRAILKRRMDRAARAMCAPAAPVRSMFVDIEGDRCLADATADHAGRLALAVRHARAERLGDRQTDAAAPR